MTATAQHTYFRPFFGVRVDLMDDVTAKNAWTLMYASFATIGFLTFINTGQAFILNANLDLPGNEQGRVTGALAFWNEAITIALAAPFGVLADRVGRRSVYCFGMISMAMGYALYPTLTASLTSLLRARCMALAFRRQPACSASSARIIHANTPAVK